MSRTSIIPNETIESYNQTGEYYYASNQQQSRDQIGYQLFIDLNRNNMTFNGTLFSDHFAIGNTTACTADNMQKKRIAISSLLNIPTDDMLHFYRFLESYSQVPSYLMGRLSALGLQSSLSFKKATHSGTIEYLNGKITYTVNMVGPFTFRDLNDPSVETEKNGSFQSIFEFDNSFNAFKHIQTSATGDVATYFEALTKNNKSNDPPNSQNRALLSDKEIREQIQFDAKIPLEVDLSDLFANHAPSTRLSRDQLSQLESSQTPSVAARAGITRIGAQLLNYKTSYISHPNASGYDESGTPPLDQTLHQKHKAEEANAAITQQFNAAPACGITPSIAEKHDINEGIKQEISTLEERISTLPKDAEDIENLPTLLEQKQAVLQTQLITRDMLRAALATDLQITNPVDQDTIINMIGQFNGGPKEDGNQNEILNGGFFFRTNSSAFFAFLGIYTQSDTGTITAKKDGNDVVFEKSATLTYVEDHGTGMKKNIGTETVAIRVTPSTVNQSLIIHPPKVTASISDDQIKYQLIQASLPDKNVIFNGSKISFPASSFADLIEIDRQPIAKLEAELQEYLESNGNKNKPYLGSSQKISQERKQQVTYLMAVITAHKEVVAIYEKKAKAGRLTRADYDAFTADHKVFMAALFDIKKEHEKDTHWWHTSKLLNRGAGDRLGKLLNTCFPTNIGSNNTTKLSAEASIALSKELDRLNITVKYAHDAGLQNISNYQRNLVKHIDTGPRIIDVLLKNLSDSLEAATGESAITRAWGDFTRNLNQYKQQGLIDHAAAKQTFDACRNATTLRLIYLQEKTVIQGGSIANLHDALNNGQLFTVMARLFDSGLIAGQVKDFMLNKLEDKQPEEMKHAMAQFLKTAGWAEFVSTRQFKQNEKTKEFLDKVDQSITKNRAILDQLIQLESLDFTQINEMEAAEGLLTKLAEKTHLADLESLGMDKHLQPLKAIATQPIAPEITEALGQDAAIAALGKPDEPHAARTLNDTAPIVEDRSSPDRSGEQTPTEPKDQFSKQRIDGRSRSKSLTLGDKADTINTQPMSPPRSSSSLFGRSPPTTPVAGPAITAKREPPSTLAK